MKVGILSNRRHRGRIYSNIGREIWREAQVMKQIRPKYAESNWDLAFTGLVKFCRSHKELYHKLEKFDRDQTRDRWYTREVQLKLRYFNHAIMDNVIRLPWGTREKPIYGDPRHLLVVNRKVWDEVYEPTIQEAAKYNLKYTVTREMHRAAQRLLKTPEQWRQQTEQGALVNQIKATQAAIRAKKMQASGFSVNRIAESLKKSPRTVYRYLSNGLKRHLNLLTRLVTCRSRLLRDTDPEIDRERKFSWSLVNIKKYKERSVGTFLNPKYELDEIMLQFGW